MVRTSIILLSLTVLIGALLYFRFPPASVLRQRQFVGTQNCRGCHATPASGDQYALWLASAHARAFAALRSASAEAYANEQHRGIPVDDSDCLRCHSNASGSSAAERGPSFSVDEGVTCEACHGAGGDYGIYAVMRDRKVFAKLGGRIGSDRDCLQCHATSLQQVHCPFQREPFAAATAMRVIAHPVPRPRAAR